MTRRAGAIVLPALVAGAMVLAAPATAALRESSVGNYYFQDDATASRERIVVDSGDQVRFTVREAGFSPHNVRVDELGIRSPDLQLFDTYTTPVLDRPGSYRLYCGRHHDNPGQPHVAVLVVRAAAPPASSATTAAPPAPKHGPPPAGAGAGAAATPSTAAAPPAVEGVAASTGASAPTEGPTPSTAVPGLGRAADRRRLPPEEGSLAAILGRRPEPGPWTRALRAGALAFGAMAATAATAVLAGARRRAART